MGLGWQAGAAGPVCEEPGSILAPSPCTLELLFVQDLGCACSGWVFESVLVSAVLLPR